MHDLKASVVPPTINVRNSLGRDYPGYTVTSIEFTVLSLNGTGQPDRIRRIGRLQTRNEGNKSCMLQDVLNRLLDENLPHVLGSYFTKTFFKSHNLTACPSLGMDRARPYAGLIILLCGQSISH